MHIQWMFVYKGNCSYSSHTSTEPVLFCGESEGRRGEGLCSFWRHLLIIILRDSALFYLDAS